MECCYVIACIKSVANTHDKLPYSGKLLREKTFAGFRATHKTFFSTKFGRAVPTYDRFSIPRRFSPRNGHSYRSAKVFSLKSFPLYGISNPGYVVYHNKFWHVIYLRIGSRLVLAILSTIGTHAINLNWWLFNLVIFTKSAELNISPKFPTIWLLSYRFSLWLSFHNHDNISGISRVHCRSKD